MTTRTLVDMVIARIKRLTSREPVETPEMVEARNAWSELLATHPKITRVEMSVEDGKYLDILLWCEGRVMPFSIFAILEEAREHRVFPGPLQTEFMKLSGYAELHDLDSLLDPKF